ncbi:MAG: DEAD/DEAH box helicase, partial [Gemmatimonadota bacterium]
MSAHTNGGAPGASATAAPFSRTDPASIARGLFPHQVEGVAFLLRRRRAILADDMGLGKTRQSITAMKVEEPEGPYLVICPASVKRNWEREIRAVLAEASVLILSGAPQPHDPPLPKAEWTVINYDILTRHEARLAAVPWRGVIVDEAHYLKNQKSKRSRSARKLVDGLRDPVVHMLTGTPLTNRPRDLFALLQLAGHPLGRSFLSFAKRYCAAYQTEYGWVTDGASNLEELALTLRGLMLRRTKDEVLELPPKLRTWLGVEIAPSTGRADTAKAVHLLLAGMGVPGARAPRDDAGGAKGRARVVAHLTSARRKIAVAKAKATIEIVENAVEQGEKVIVFSAFDEPVQKIAAHFGEAAVKLTGATPSGKRQQIVDAFQEDEGVRVLVANIIAGGVGLNLTAARQVVFNDLDWVPANHWQAEDRAYRIGQTGTVNVTYVTAAGHAVDEFVASTLAAKAALVEAVVEGRAIDDEATRDVLSELERIVGQLSPRMADTGAEELGGEAVEALLREAVE